MQRVPRGQSSINGGPGACKATLLVPDLNVGTEDFRGEYCSAAASCAGVAVVIIR